MVAEVRLDDRRKPGIPVLLEHAGNDHHPVRRPGRRRPAQPDVTGGQRLQFVDPREQRLADRPQGLQREGPLVDLGLAQGVTGEFVERADRDMASVPQAIAQEAQQEEQADGPELVVQADEAPAPLRSGRGELEEALPEVLPSAAADRGEQVLGVAILHQDLDLGAVLGPRSAGGQVVGAVVPILGDVDVVGRLDAGGAQRRPQTRKQGGRVRIALAAGVDHQLGGAGAEPLPPCVRQADGAGIGDQPMGLGDHHQVRGLGDRFIGPKHPHPLILKRVEQRNAAFGHQHVEPARIVRLCASGRHGHACGRVPAETHGASTRLDFSRRREIDQPLGYAPDHRGAELHRKSLPAPGGLTCGPPPGLCAPDHRPAR